MKISFNTMGWTRHDDPNFDMISTDYSITPGVWNHLVVCHNEGKHSNKCISMERKLLKMLSLILREEKT